MNDETRVTIKWDYDWFVGGIFIFFTITLTILMFTALNTFGFEREMWEYVGKIGALIEDGYEAQRKE